MRRAGAGAPPGPFFWAAGDAGAPRRRSFLVAAEVADDRRPRVLRVRLLRDDRRLAGAPGGALGDGLTYGGGRPRDCERHDDGGEAALLQVHSRPPSGLDVG